MTFLKFSVALSLATFIATGSAVDSEPNTERRGSNMNQKFFGRSDWKPCVVQIYQSGDKASRKVSAKRALYKYELPTDCKLPPQVPPGSCTGFYVTVFMSESGAVWAGPEQDIYIEVGSNILGITENLGFLAWQESFLSKQKKQLALENLVSFFENNVTEREMAKAESKVPKAGTSLRKALKPEFFYEEPNTPALTYAKLGIVTIRPHGNELFLELKSPGGHFTASVCIDVVTKNVLKAVQDGKQVYPK